MCPHMSCTPTDAWQPVPTKAPDEVQSTCDTEQKKKKNIALFCPSMIYD